MRTFKIKCDMCGKEEESYEEMYNYIAVKPASNSSGQSDFCSENCILAYYKYKLESNE